MRFMLLQNYEETEGCSVPMTEWKPEDVTAHIRFQQTLNEQLTESGELVDAQGLAGPEQATFVVSDGTSAPVITDGPFPESKELLAGYRLVDVETAARAIEIAAQASAAPGPAGVPIRQAIEVRQVMGAPADSEV
jgi:hypothetical protein